MTTVIFNGKVYNYLVGATYSIAQDPESFEPDGKVIEGPEIPPEVHNPRPIDPEACVAATRAMCG